jgi:hypothetical protein
MVLADCLIMIYDFCLDGCMEWYDSYKIILVGCTGRSKHFIIYDVA